MCGNRYSSDTEWIVSTAVLRSHSDYMAKCRLFGLWEILLETLINAEIWCCQSLLFNLSLNSSGMATRCPCSGMQHGHCQTSAVASQPLSLLRSGFAVLQFMAACNVTVCWYFVFHVPATTRPYTRLSPNCRPSKLFQPLHASSILTMRKS